MKGRLGSRRPLRVTTASRADAGGRYPSARAVPAPTTITSQSLRRARKRAKSAGVLMLADVPSGPAPAPSTVLTIEARTHRPSGHG